MPFCSTPLVCRRILLTCIVAILSGTLPVTFTQAQKESRKPKENRRADSHEIQSLEGQWRAALVHADTGVLDRMLADDFLAISSNGTLSDKQQYLHRITSHTNQFSSIELIDIKTRVQPTSAIAISQTHVVGTLEGRPINGIFRYTKVYARNALGQWRVVNFEATRVAGPSMEAAEMHRGLPLASTSSHH